MQKNKAGYHLDFQLNLVANGFNATGLTGIVVKVKKDGAPESTGAGGVSEISDGGYTYIVPQSETDADQVSWAMTHPEAITQRVNIFPVTSEDELAKVIKSDELTRHVQGTINSQTDVEVTATRV